MHPRGLQYSCRFRWWLVACGITLGLGAGVKWSAFYVAAAFGVATFLYDVVSRRALGIRWPIHGVRIDVMRTHAVCFP